MGRSHIRTYAFFACGLCQIAGEEVYALISLGRQRIAAFLQFDLAWLPSRSSAVISGMRPPLALGESGHGHGHVQASCEQENEATRSVLLRL